MNPQTSPHYGVGMRASGNSQGSRICVSPVTGHYQRNQTFSTINYLFIVYSLVRSNTFALVKPSFLIPVIIPLLTHSQATTTVLDLCFLEFYI